MKQRRGEVLALFPLPLTHLYIPQKIKKGVRRRFWRKMEKDYSGEGDGEVSAVVTEQQQQPNADETYLTTYHLAATPSGLTQDEFDELRDLVAEFHMYKLSRGRCSSLLAQRVQAPPDTVWSIVRRFDKPQSYKHFIKSCTVSEGFTMKLGCTREVNVISGLPADTSKERLDIHDDERRVIGFSIIGGEHRLRNYRSVTSVHQLERDGKIWSVVLESYAVDVPPGNTEEDARLFADTVVKLNLQKLASVAEVMNRGDNR
ncbi:abscisic acid receptor PYR1-like [Cucurbita maxima]|uniref:Abscisic acid receptor PYR1-like n=1 Tax=Cucurbita maxima TaxID=3661 RepID=A0A6J1HQ71_CUCMA|nr:abscisic acid receptor PYR1-like [Cucurbita maxima]